MVTLTTIKNYRVPRMNLKVKGLLKGLRCISHVFGDHEKEKVEMRISFPTDVKHITHIGCVNGDSATTPSWMNEFKQANGGIESDILQAIARSIEVLTTEESVVSSSRKVIVKTKLDKDSKPPGTRRRKEGRPIRQKDVSSRRAPGDPEAKPKKTRRRRKKKAVKDGSATSISSTKSISSKAASVPPTEGEGGLDRVKSGAMYMSAHESSDIEGSTRSYCTVASGCCRDGEEDGEKRDLVDLERYVLLV